MNKSNPKSNIFSALEVANICGVVNQTAINWIKNGYLKAFKTPGGQFRVYADDLIAFMNSRSMRIPDDLIKKVNDKNEAMSILVVDDDSGFNTVTAKFLERKFPNVQILQAFDGFEAASILMEKKPSCVILDLDLPGVNGLEICRKIKEDEKYGEPAVIIVTGLQDEETRNNCYDSGAADFFSKPVDFVKLSDTVKSLLG